MNGIVIQGSCGFHQFTCFRCRQRVMEVKQSSDVVAAYLGQKQLVCEECSKPKPEVKEAATATT